MLLAVFIPQGTDAAEVKMVSYEEYQKTIIYKPTEDVIDEARKNYEREHPKSKPVIKRTGVAGNCSCVAGINNYYKTSFKTLDGYARSIPVSSKLPATTGFVITYESWMGHIAHYYLDGEFIVIDAEWNYIPCRFSSGRKLPISSPLIKGFL